MFNDSAVGRQLVVSGYRVWRFPGGTEMTDSIIILMSNSILENSDLV
jgi:hypothetical protein